jgi:aryl-alcohol dehydrogenase-like predicted oxidoreductase
MWGPQDEAGSIATIHAALDHGITLLDTAPAYGDGRSEEIVGRALRDRRDRALVATKISEADMTPARALASCESSLRRLQTDRIDLLQIHWLGAGEQLEDVIAAMESLRAAGKVRALGVCNFGPQSLARLRAAGAGWITNQLAYNLLWRAVEFEITATCEQDGLGILCYSPLHQGLLTGRFHTADDVPAARARTRHFRGDRPLSRHGGPGCEALTFATIGRLRALAAKIDQPMGDMALAWLLHQRAVQSVIFGARSVAQIEENIRASQLKLTPEILAELDRATADLKRALGPNADMWAPVSRIR